MGRAAANTEILPIKQAPCVDPAVLVARPGPKGSELSVWTSAGQLGPDGRPVERVFYRDHRGILVTSALYVPLSCPELGEGVLAREGAWFDEPDRVEDESRRFAYLVDRTGWGIIYRGPGGEVNGAVLKTSPVSASGHVALTHFSISNSTLHWSRRLTGTGPQACGCEHRGGGDLCYLRTGLLDEVASLPDDVAGYLGARIGEAEITRSDRGTITARWDDAGGLDIEIALMRMSFIDGYHATLSLGGRALAKSVIWLEIRSEACRMCSGRPCVHLDILRRHGVLASV